LIQAVEGAHFLQGHLERAEEALLIAEEAVKRKLAPQVGRETIRILLQSHELKPWREKKLVHRRTE
jgi:hypothetical protein